LLFNESDKNSYDDIVKATQLQADVLDPSLGIFLKAKVLLMNGGDGDNEKPGPGKTFTLNYEFKSKKLRVNLNIAVKSEQKQEVDDTHKTIEEDRKLLMQVSNLKAAIEISVLLTCSVCNCTYHEGPKEDEAHPTRQRMYQSDPISFRAQGPGHQEVHRHLVGEGVLGTSGRRRARLSCMNMFLFDLSSLPVY